MTGAFTTGTDTLRLGSEDEPNVEQQQELAALFNQGRYPQAAALAQKLTNTFPLHGLAWKVLGAVYKLTGRSDDALSAMKRAVALAENDAETHSNLALILKGRGSWSDAESGFRRALCLDPEYVEAHNNLGVLQFELDRLSEAEACYRKALSFNPGFAEAHGNLGNTLRGIGRLDDAVTSFRRAIKLRPDLAELRSNLGNSLRDQGQLDEAVSSYYCALVLNPQYAVAHSNLANTLADAGRFELAAASSRYALEINPNHAGAQINLGNALKALWQLDEAVACFQTALAIEPDYTEAYSNLGTVLQDSGCLDAAQVAYRRALAITPDDVISRSNLLFVGNYLPVRSAANLLAEARAFGDLAIHRASPYTNWPNRPDVGRCLRVGLVSGDLLNHSVGHFVEAILGEFSAHYAGRVEVIAYVTQMMSDTVTERIKACCDGWHRVVGLTDEVLARRIRDDGIDILLDLSGHTAGNRLPMFAWKPAPVQVSWLGYFATTGISDMDYLIADPWTLPKTEECNFTERIWRLPETRLCFTPPDAAVNVSPLPALRNGYITFGCFNNLTKVNDDVVARWAKVLSAVPESRLFLKAKQFQDTSLRRRMAERFAANGIDQDRLILEGMAPRAEYLAAYQRVDIALDPFPFTGGTTSVEGLWMGVPVLSLAGESFVSRQGVGLLMNAGLPEWIATDADDYVARAVAHAGDLQALAQLRNGLRKQVLASPIFDAPRFARNFEAALRGMWTRWCHQ